MPIPSYSKLIIVKQTKKFNNWQDLFLYDDLNRLLSATATNSSNNYSYTYTYNKLGNITSSPLGTYTYSSSSYANPHAVTSIGSTNYTYDNNGNLLTETNGLNNTWDYDNRLIQTVKNGITTTYDYDHTGQRVKQSNGTTTTLYPTKYYNTDGTNINKHIFNPKTGELLATIKGTGANAVTSYIHTDHLGSTDKVTNTLAEITELSDYYPYGSPNISTQYSGTKEQRKYTGHEFDKDTELTYANARYYNQNIGRFLSQDPVYLLVGSKDFEKKWNTNWRNIQQGKNSALTEYLSNPQNLNSYSYTLNNPLKYTDPNGEFYQFAIGTLVGGVGGVVSQYTSDVLNNYQSSKSGWDAFTQLSSVKTYAVRAGQGIVVGLAATSGNLYTIGATAFTADVVSDKALGRNVDWINTTIDTAITMGTAGILREFPKVSGRLPSSITSSAFWAGKHTQNEVIKETINQGVNLIKETGKAIFNSFKQLKAGI